MKRSTIAAAAVAALACMAGCGSGDEPQAALRPMGAAAPEREVAQDNTAPVIESLRLDPASPTPGLPVRAQVVASDAEGDPLRIAYRWTRNGQTLSGANDVVLDTDALGKGDRLGLEVVASDGRLESEPARISSTLGNRSPLVQQVTIAPSKTVRPGDELSALVTAVDPDDDHLDFAYVWLVNGEQKQEGSERTFSSAHLRRGDAVTVRVVARDGHDDSAPATSAVVTMGNSPPVIRGVPTPRSQGGTFTYQFEAEDPDGDRNLRFSLESAPAGMSIDPVLGTATFHPDPGQVGTHPVEVVVSDPTGDSSSLRFNMAVTQTAGDPASTRSDTPPARIRD